MRRGSAGWRLTDEERVTLRAEVPKLATTPRCAPGSKIGPLVEEMVRIAGWHGLRELGSDGGVRPMEPLLDMAKVRVAGPADDILAARAQRSGRRSPRAFVEKTRIRIDRMADSERLVALSDWKRHVTMIVVAGYELRTEDTGGVPVSAVSDAEALGRRGHRCCTARYRENVRRAFRAPLAAITPDSPPRLAGALPAARILTGRKPWRGGDGPGGLRHRLGGMMSAQSDVLAEQATPGHRVAVFNRAVMERVEMGQGRSARGCATRIRESLTS